MINHIQINNFMENRRRIIRRNEVIDVNQVILDMSENNKSINRKSPEPYDDINYNLLYNENTESEGEKKEFELHSFLNDEKICRICYGGEKYDNELIHPCLCKGTQKYIHLKCLQEWRKINKDNPEKRDYCEICKYHYAIKEYDDYLKYKIQNDIVTNMLLFILSIFCGAIIWPIDYFSDFIIIKLLTFFDYEKNILYIKFSNIKDINKLMSYETSIYTYIYALYIVNLSQVIILRGYLYSNRIYIRNSNKNKYYKKKIKFYKNSFNIMSFSIFYSIYLSTLFNEIHILSNMTPIIFIINFSLFNFYILNHNRFLKNIHNFNVQNQLIYSFEENPLILHLGEL